MTPPFTTEAQRFTEDHRGREERGETSSLLLLFLLFLLCESLWFSVPLW